MGETWAPPIRVPLSPAASTSCPAVRGPFSRFQLGPDGFLNTLPQHGWLNGVPRGRVHHRDLLHHLGPFAPVAAGVHVDATAGGPGHADEDVQPRETRSG